MEQIRSYLRTIKSFSMFTKILQIIRPSPNSVYNCHHAKGIKLQDLKLGLSHLREYKFKHSFHDSINPLCNCGCDVQSTIHFFLHCPFFINERRTLISTISSIDTKLDNTDSFLTQISLFGNGSHNLNNNFKIISTSALKLHFSTYGP